MLKKIRIICAVISLVALSLLFLDFTGTIHHFMGWLAKVQFVPALLALNFTIVISLLILTFVLGRVYCSVICPLGIFQDFISRIAGKFKKNRFAYSKSINWLRYTILILFIIPLIMGLGSLISFLEPYSIYGRIAGNLLAPAYQFLNNILAYFSERVNSYTFYPVEIWIKSLITLGVAVGSLIIIGILAWLNGRTYCNTICPVGTFLGFISRFSLLRPVINHNACNSCGLCARNCKASCIDSKTHYIDYSRCVTCMNCIEKCNRNAMKYKFAYKPVLKTEDKTIATDDNNNRRNFLTIASLFAITALIKGQQKKVEGGLAVIKDKQVPKRATSLTPPGSLSAKNLTKHCTACGLCISACPNGILQPSNQLKNLMQPFMTYEKGYCRPECTRCSEVCPTGAIIHITPAEKSAIQIGHAVWLDKNCVVGTDGVSCGNCARHCPTGAITMVSTDPDDPQALKIPAVDTERCIGCGACENLCPARPFSAIYVEGHIAHRII
jgi:ferredoxin